nr:nitrogenase component 1 [Candidatus Gracilibacteria bacterium]
MNREEIIKNRIINPEDFLGKRYTPSIFIKNSFFKLFNLVDKDFGEKFSINNLVFEQDKFRILLSSKDGKDQFDFYIKDNFGNKKCNGEFCTDNICTGVHYKPNDNESLKFLIYFSKKGKDLTFKYFLEILSKDYKAKKEYYQIFWKANRPPFSIIQDWGHETHKFRFIVPEGVLRNIDQSIELNVAHGYIHHSERECLAIGPSVDPDKEFTFFSYPNGFYDHTFNKYFYLSEEEKNIILKKDSKSGVSVFTDLSEDDIVMGKGNEKLSSSLDYLASQIEKESLKLLSFNCCCVPRVIGDDIKSILEKTKQNIKIPFIFKGQLEKTPFEQKISLLEDYLDQISKQKFKKNKKSISLFGYHENKYLEKLYFSLKENNVSLNAIFIPTINIELLQRLYETELFVFSNNKFQEEIFEYPFKNMGIDYISPNYPYGIKKTDEWFDEIYKYFGEKYFISNENIKIIEDFSKKSDYIKSKNYRIGLIFLGKKQLETFFDSDYNNNVDIIDFLEEMGFGIDFLIYDNLKEYFIVNNEIRFTEEDINQKVISNLIKNKVKTEEYTINFFSSEQEMKDKIDKLNINLVYSDIYTENRFYENGVNFFNIRAFKEGYLGALDTINYMIKLIEIDYYKNFSKYF